MITNVHTYKDEYGETHHIVARHAIRHPMADEMSFAIGDNGQCHFPLSVEIAFFKEGEWVDDILPEFASYAEGFGYTVYPWVPSNIAFEFLHLWK